MHSFLAHLLLELLLVLAAACRVVADSLFLLAIALAILKHLQLLDLFHNITALMATINNVTRCGSREQRFICLIKLCLSRRHFSCC